MFDHIFIAVLIFTAFVCRENINVVSVVAIITFQLVIDQLAWPLMNLLPYFKFFLYIIAFGLIYYLQHDKLIYLILPVTILTALTEIYWQVTEYSGPQITWYVWLMISQLIVRHLLFIRVAIVDSYFSKQGVSINLDWVIYKLAALTVLVQAIMLLEYLARHLGDLSDLLMMYAAFPYIVQCIGTITIWVVFHESYKLLLPKLLKV
ncbi:hypothetical protein RS130_18190 [Paraglaciecola aquimarina]|uniref:Integral membrane protein n=1 Tax=Paraglaciecola aquimarina TaxID=1235557 RepID=A0ABU3T001_9ALTE|nr:hypothetical protein [Paraglaciecola aquimarina]MDU0355568.1 hypothetical protein [Paraglaciecola aquimarina]